MLTDNGKKLLKRIKASEAELAAEKTAKLEREALEWVEECIKNLDTGLEKTGLGDALYILGTEGDKLNEGDRLKIKALDKALGIDLMSRAQFEDVRFHAWSVSIIVSDLKALLEAAEQA
ncbi:MAG: hypothetical protein WC641_05870 [Patescibacteria group bacterium]